MASGKVVSPGFAASGLRHKLTILKLATETDPVYGEQKETWQIWKNVWGRVEDLHGLEVYPRHQKQTPQTTAQVDGRMVIRYRRDLDPALYRVKHGPTTYNIVAVLQNDPKHRVTVLLVQARTPDQPDGGCINA